MTRSLASLLNIRPRERPRVLILYAMAFLFFAGITWAQMTVESSFYIIVGVDKLALVFAANAIGSIIVTVTYTAFVDRISNTTLLIAILLASAPAVVFGLVLRNQNEASAYLLLYVFVKVIQSAFRLHWWTYVNSFYDTRAAKRIVPVVSSAFRVATIFAGLTLDLMNNVLGSAENVIAVWVGLLITVAAVAWAMPLLLKGVGTTGEEAERATSPRPSRQRTSYVQNMREGFRYVSGSSFLRWMALATIGMTLITVLFNYWSGKVFGSHFSSREALSDYVGYLTAATNLLMLPIEAFLLSRIIGRIGLGNANLIFPLGALAISGSLVGFPVSMASASLAYYGRTSFRFSVREPSNNLLYNAVPLRVKGRARAFITGLVIPMGLLLSSAMLSLVRATEGRWLLSTLVIGVAVLQVISAVVIRKKYSRALITMLEQEDFSFLLSTTSNLAVTDATTLNWLTKKLEESTSSDFTIFMANLISEVGGSEAVPILGQIARAGDAHVRSTVLDLLVAAGLRGEAVRQIYAEFLDDPDGGVRRSAIAGLEQCVETDSEQFLEQALELLPDPVDDVRAQVIPPLVHSGDFFYLASAIQALSQLVADDDPDRRARGVHVLGQVGDVRFIRNLVQYLQDPADQVRVEAATAIESLSQDEIPDRISAQLMEHLSPLLHEPVERVRGAAVAILERVNTPQAHQLLVRFLTDASLQVREAAVNALARIGKPVIPILSPALEGGDPQQRKMAAVVLSHIDREQFGGLVESLIDDNLLAVYRNHSYLEALSPYATYPSISILESMLDEENHKLTDEVFYLLTAIRDPEAVNIVTESLNSESARVRANAVEALESLMTPQVAGLIAPLFGPEPTPAQVLQAAKDILENVARLDVAEAIRKLITDPGDPWLRATMTLALGEIGATLTPGEDLSSPPTDETQRPASLDDRIASTLSGLEKADRQDAPTARRPPPQDLLGVLMGEDEEDTLAQPSEEVQPSGPPAPPVQLPLTLREIESMLKVSLDDPAADVRIAAQAAQRALAGLRVTDAAQEEKTMLSTIERIIFLKEVPFFQGMTVDQLKVVANICEEELFAEDTRVFEQGDPGGTLHVVVSGRVAIEREGQRKGSVVRLATVEAHSYFGELSFFDNSPRSAAAVAIQDTLTLRLSREPLVALARRYPDLSLALINVVSQRLREANDRIAQLTRSRPRELEKLYDRLE